MVVIGVTLFIEFDRLLPHRNFLQPLNRLGQADEVVTLVNFLASDEASFITGGLQPIYGGYIAQ